MAIRTAYRNRFSPNLADLGIGSYQRPEGLPFYEEDPASIVVKGDGDKGTGATMAGPSLQTTMIMPTSGTGTTLAALPNFNLTGAYPTVNPLQTVASLGGGGGGGGSFTWPDINFPDFTVTGGDVVDDGGDVDKGDVDLGDPDGGGFNWGSLLGNLLGTGLAGVLGGGATTASGIGGAGVTGATAAGTSPALAQTLPTSTAPGLASTIQSMLGLALPIAAPAAMAWMLYNAFTGKGGKAATPYDPNKVEVGYVPTEFDKTMMLQDPTKTFWTSEDFYQKVQELGTPGEQLEKFKEIYGIGDYTYGAGNDPIKTSRESPEQAVVHRPAADPTPEKPAEVESESNNIEEVVQLVKNVTPPKVKNEVTRPNQVDNQKLNTLVSQGVDQGLASAVVANDRNNFNSIVFNTTPAQVAPKTVARPGWGKPPIGGPHGR